jgi:hypothetical protein
VTPQLQALWNEVEEAAQHLRDALQRGSPLREIEHLAMQYASAAARHSNALKEALDIGSE